VLMLLVASCSQPGTSSSVLPGADAAQPGDAARGGEAGRDAAKAGEAGPDGAAPAASVCPGTDLPTGRQLCRTVQDCGPSAFNRCSFEYVPPVGCGACNRPTVQCTTDTDCRGDGGAADRICVAMDLPCTCGGQNTMCAPGCTATSCGKGSRCNATGRCELIPCTEGYDCGPTALCAPGRPGAFPNGCAIKSCRTDGFACAAGMECWPAGGDMNGCGPLRCDHGGAPCPVNSRCVGGGGTGCQTKSCTQDADCDCGACIQKLCYARLFICSPVGSP
jgi:hypothetical protein